MKQIGWHNKFKLVKSPTSNVQSLILLILVRAGLTRYKEKFGFLAKRDAKSKGKLPQPGGSPSGVIFPASVQGYINRLNPPLLTVDY